MENNARRHRGLRISLRALLVALTMLCVFLGWWTHRAQKQRAAVKWAQSLGEVVYDFEMLPLGSWEPSLWHKTLGVDYFENVHYVRLSSYRVDDLSLLSHLPGIKVLDIKYCKTVTDYSVLSKLRSLRELKAAKSGIEDLNPISGLTHLESLDLRATNIDDLTPLSQLKKLVNLNVSDTSISDLQIIQEMPCLEYVNVSRTAVPMDEIMRLRKELPDCLIAY